MQEQTLNEKESIALIERMIQNTRKDLGDNGIYYLLWGYAVIIASLCHYFLLQIEYKYHFIGWPIIMPLAAVFAVIIGFRLEKKARVRTQLDSISTHLWLACFAGMMLVIAFMSRIGYENFQGLIVMIYSIGLFVSGAMYKFKPLVLGAIIAFLCAVAMFFVTFENQLLLSALSLFLSYLIPGHLLIKRAKNA